MALSKPARTFQDLLVWQKAHGFVLEAYAFTATFSKPETYGLSLQIHRAAVSIPANIAAGFRRRGKADKARFLNMAEGSVEECRYFLILAKDLGYGRHAEDVRDFGRSQPAPECVLHRDSDFLDFWLLTSISRKDIKGEALG